MIMLLRHKLSAELLWVACGHLINLAGLVIALKLLTTILGPRAFGEYALGLAIAGMIQMFVFGPISQATLRFFSVKRKKNKLDEFYRFLSGLQIKVISILMLVAAIFYPLVSMTVGERWGFITLVATVAAISGGVSTVMAAIFTANRSRVVVALFQGIGAVIGASFSVGGIIIFAAEGRNALTGYALASVLMTAIYYWYSKKSLGLPKLSLSFQVTENTDFGKQFWLFARPFVFFALFGSVVNYGDRWVVQALFDQNMVGIYTAIFQIANTPLSLFGTIVAQLVLPVFYASGQRSILEQQVRHYRLVIAVSGVLLLLGVMAAYFFSKFLLTLFTSPDFVIYHNVLWMMVLGCAIFQFAQLTVMRGLVELRPHAYINAKAIHAVSFVVVMILIGNHFSLMGVAMAISISSLFYLGAISIANLRSDKVVCHEVN